jgi:endonuclease G
VKVVVVHAPRGSISRALDAPRLAALLLFAGACTESVPLPADHAETPSLPARPAASPHSPHLEMGTPADADPSDDELMLKPQYALSYNRRRNGPNWVSWRLDAGDLGAVIRRRGRFLADALLPAGFYRVQHDDYRDSGYERGHLVPSHDRTRTAEDNRATFLLTNVLPQRGDLNGGPWERLERRCHDLAAKDDRALYQVAGGVFPERPETIGGGVAVPEAFFKIAVVLRPGQGAADVQPSTRVIAVIMPNLTGVRRTPWATYRTTVRAIERRTGYDFLSRVPAVIQEVIETREDAEAEPDPR